MVIISRHRFFIGFPSNISFLPDFEITSTLTRLLHQALYKKDRVSIDMDIDT